MKQQMQMLSLLLVCLAFLVPPTYAFWAHVMRHLTGSNCVRIENGKIPPYYTCLGCLIEEATGCIDDMRQNSSGNVGVGCDMSIITESYNTACCPRFGDNWAKRYDLMYVGSAYPEALRCIEAVGCKDSVIYEQLYAECESACPQETHKDQTGKGAACLADFNSASKSIYFASLSVILSIVFTVCYLL